MDTMVKICLGLIILIAAAFTGITSYTGYTETAFRNTITGTYTYTCAITTDAPLYNVTLFIPVPADNTGNSPMVSGFSNRAMSGVPADWETTLFDTGKSTLLKVTTPAIIPPDGTSVQHPHTITISSETSSRTPIDTRNPVEKSAMYRPVQDLKEHPCPPGSADTGTRCFTFTTSMYADYTTAEETTVRIVSNISGTNTWTIFEPYSSEYYARISAGLEGGNHGWTILEGVLSSGTGPDILPVLSSHPAYL